MKKDSQVYLSCGGGRQSTALALMAIHNELVLDNQPYPVRAILFADTGWERPATYANIDNLRALSEKEGGPPIITVSNGHIRNDTLDPLKRSPTMPFYVNTSKTETPEEQLERLQKTLEKIDYPLLFDIDEELTIFLKGIQRGDVSVLSTQGNAMLRRQCTKEYKIEPINQFIREDCGATFKNPATVLIGISLDEVTRMSTSQVQYINNRYPLVEMRWRTLHCLEYLEMKGWQEPVRSSCIGCPYHSKKEWQALTPAEFADACEFDQNVRKAGLTHPAKREPYKRNEIYLHSSLKPLEEVDFDNDGETDDMIHEECQGGCFL